MNAQMSRFYFPIQEEKAKKEDVIYCVCGSTDTSRFMM